MKLAFSKGINYLYIGAEQLRAALGNMFAQRPILISLIITLVANILTWIFAGSLNRILGDDLAILHYNVIFGIDKVGTASGLYLLPVTGLGLMLANLILILVIGHKRQRLLSNLIAGTMALGNLILLLALYLIYLVNFS